METPKEVFKTDWFSIDAIPQKNQKPYYRLSCNDSVVVIAQTVERKLIIIRQYRPAIDGHVLEWPAGLVDRGESAAVAARRELAEETGFSCDSVDYLGKFRVLPCRVNSFVHLYFGKGAKKTAKPAEGEQDIEVMQVSGEEFERLLIESGELFSVATIGFYHFAKIKKLL